ncbi:MAG: hypothetical protein COW13_02490 [Candidatus Omnitrophica bacterium CG12_big_fil_rev_8_21_14_0_65_50_5]|nr:MAG: hypothetical protein COW13_02490 [Candidatus Omnitrophica bacterium CG12_big_fil_rev_8_21_14_0_65_50_5]
MKTATKPKRTKAGVPKRKKTAKIAKKAVKPVRKAGAAKAAPLPGVVVGPVTHYFPKVKAAVIKLEKPLSMGDTIVIAGKSGKIRQKVTSLQINRIPIDEGRAGEEVGLEVKKDVVVGDVVYRL